MTARLFTTLALVLWSVPAFAQAPAGPAGTVRYYHADAVGSIRAVTDANGQVVARHDYFAFGDEPANAPNPAAQRFTGQERDRESGMDYFGARYYASRTGRMTTVDPLMDVEAALFDPQQWNRYAYARNNPLVFVDPTGASIELIGSASDRDAALVLLQAAVGDAGEFLYINELDIDGIRRYFVGIRGDLGRFMRFGESAHTLANLVSNTGVVEFRLTKDDLSFWGGSRTIESGKEGNANTRVLVQRCAGAWRSPK
jgi:RHS repeat-associated protein